MSNLRLLYDDEAPSATITASTTAGGLVADNLKNNEPEQVWRATGKSATLTLTWANPIPVGLVVLGWSNLTPTAVISAAFYTNAVDASPVVVATGSADSAVPLGAFVFGAEPIGVGTSDVVKILSNATVWLGHPEGVEKIIITISDVNNDENIQVGRVLAGLYHESDFGAAPGVNLTFIDTSTVARTESGSIRFEPRRVRRRVELSLPALSPLDSIMLMRFFSLGRARVVFVCLFPSASDIYNQTHAFIAYPVNDGSHNLGLTLLAQSNMTFEELL